MSGITRLITPTSTDGEEKRTALISYRFLSLEKSADDGAGGEDPIGLGRTRFAGSLHWVVLDVCAGCNRSAGVARARTGAMAGDDGARTEMRA